MRTLSSIAVGVFTVLVLMAVPAFGGEGVALSDQELATITAGAEETDAETLDGQYTVFNHGGVMLNGSAQSSASALVIENLNDSRSIVQMNIAISFGGDVKNNTATNTVQWSQNH